MTARPRPWMKFSPDRWRNDEALRMCGAAARGVWVELICIMHKAEPYGHLLVRGKQPTDRQLSVMTGIPVLELSAALHELEENEVFSRNGDGVIFSRGMVRDEDMHQRAAELGAKGAKRRYQKENEKSGPHRGAHSQPQGDPHRLEIESESDIPPVVPHSTGEKTELPDDWEPRLFGADSAAGQIVAGWTIERFNREVESFRSHHRRKRSRYSDWQDTWGTWVRNAAAFDERRAQPAAEPKSYAERVLEELGVDKPEKTKTRKKAGAH